MRSNVLPFPVERDDAPRPDPAIPAHVPRWCVQRFPEVGSDAITIVGFDGDGYPLCKTTVKLTSDLLMWERAATIEVESERRKSESGPPFLPPTLRRLN